MRKKVIFLLFAAVFVAFCLAACGGGPDIQAPKAEQMPVVEKNAWDVYDRFPDVLTKEEATEANLKKMGLKKAVLEDSERSFNQVDKKNNRYEPDGLLESGTVVWQYKGITVYKDGCMNKQFIPVKLVFRPLAVGVGKDVGGLVGLSPSVKSVSSNWWSWTGLGDFLNGMAMVIGGFSVGLFLLGLVLGALAVLIWLLFRQLRRPAVPAIAALPANPPATPPAAIIPGPMPHEAGVGVFFGQGGRIRVVNQWTDVRSLTIDGDRVQIDARIHRPG